MLPVLVPDLGYDDMEIGNGDTASVVFVVMVRGRYGNEEVNSNRQALFSYCGLNAMAMVRLHEKLVGWM